MLLLELYSRYHEEHFSVCKTGRRDKMSHCIVVVISVFALRRYAFKFLFESNVIQSFKSIRINYRVIVHTEIFFLTEKVLSEQIYGTPGSVITFLLNLRSNSGKILIIPIPRACG